MGQLPAFPGLVMRKDRTALSATKSALQKYVRRGEVDKAMATTAYMLRALEGGRDALRRRIPVIAAEDVGYWWIPAVVDKMQGGEVGILDAVEALASSPKSKEGCWLSYIWQEPNELSYEWLVEAIRTGDHVQTASTFMKMYEDGWLKKKPGLLTPIWRDLPEEAGTLVKGVLRILAMGHCIEAFGAFAIAVIEAPKIQLVAIPPRRSEPSLALPEPLDWYTQDQHTYFGKVALSIYCKRAGLDSKSVGALQFWHESIQLGPVELPARWREEARDRAVNEHGWGTWERSHEAWQVHRPEVRSIIQWLQRKNLDRGEFA